VISFGMKWRSIVCTPDIYAVYESDTGCGLYRIVA
jgi:hypothetical protein